MRRDPDQPAITQTALWFGGDYNPEQWPEEVWPKDLTALGELNANTVILPVFAWGKLQPAKDRFEFGWLDRVLEGLAAERINVIMATPTAAQPAWMSEAYPTILPVDAEGRRRRHGGRVNYCPTSDAYREGSVAIASALAERYRGHDGLVLWHVNNEYGPVCYCERCRSSFQRWLADRYSDLDAVNNAWGTAVWGNTLHDWGEIDFPSNLNAMSYTREGQVRFSAHPGIVLDHARYVSVTLLECFLAEKAAIRRSQPQTPVTTNFHGPFQTVDWHEWGPHLDLTSWDSYPQYDGHWSEAAFGHDLARGAGNSNDFLLMEASPGPVNWHSLCPLKRPGEVRRHALQAVAHGSRGALYFQVRQARAGNELNHSALIPRHGRLDTRMGEELIQLGRDLTSLEPVSTDHEVHTKVALVFDWPSWWAHHATPGLDQRSRYPEVVRAFYQTLVTAGIAVDVVGAHTALDRYDAVVAPGLYMVDDEMASAFQAYVEKGGTLVTTTGSGIVGTDGRVHEGGIHEVWRFIFGLWVEETDAQPPQIENAVIFHDNGTNAIATELFDILRPTTAEVLATYRDDFYAGSPAVTVNGLGAGRAIYLASPSTSLLAEIARRFLPERSRWCGSPDTEVIEWTAPDSTIAFLLNHGTEPDEIAVPLGSWANLFTGETLPPSVMLEPGSVLVVGSRP